VFIQQGVEEIIQWHFASVCSLFVLLCDEKWKFAGRLGPWASRTSVVHVMLRGPFHAVWTTRFFACFARNVTGSKTSQVQLCPSCRSYLNCQCAFENVSMYQVQEVSQTPHSFVSQNLQLTQSRIYQEIEIERILFHTN
jgi:hypothetical protein